MNTLDQIPVISGTDRMTDPAREQVDHPEHYNQGRIECIDAIEAALGREGFIAWLRGTIIKYQWRLGRKNDPSEDAAKAEWYSARLTEYLRKDPTE